MAISVSPNIITSGLVAAYDGASLKQSLTTWPDLSGNGNHATLANNIFRAVGGSANFTSSGLLSFTPTSGFQFTGDFTVECWVCAPTTGTAAGVLAFPHTTSNFASILLYYDGTNLQLYSSNNNTSWNISSGTNFGTLVKNKWHHVAVSRSGSSMCLFFDGVLVTTISTSANLYNAAFTSGYIGDTASNGNFLGYIKDVHVVNGTALYTSSFTPPTIINPISNTVMLACSGGLNDRSPNNITLTSSGTVSLVNYGAIIHDGTTYNWTTNNLPALTEYAFEFVMKPTSASADAYPTLFNMNGQNNTNGFIWAYRSGGALIWQYANGTNYLTTNSGSTVLTNNAFSHITIVVSTSGQTVKYYLNGALINTATATGIKYIPAGTLYMGTYQGATTSSYRLSGEMHMLRVYNTTLTDTQVAQNFNAIRGRYGL